MDRTDLEIAAMESLEKDSRIASAPDGYADSRSAVLDLDEAERLRYMYVEREMLAKYQLEEFFDELQVPFLRATAHDVAIRETALERIGALELGVAWLDVARKAK